MTVILSTKADGAVVTGKQAMPSVPERERGYTGTIIPSRRGQAIRYGSLRPYISESGAVGGIRQRVKMTLGWTPITPYEKYTRS